MFLRKGPLIGYFASPVIPHLFKLGRAEERVGKLVDSPDQPESEASYKLTEGGWEDV